MSFGLRFRGVGWTVDGTALGDSADAKGGQSSVFKAEANPAKPATARWAFGTQSKLTAVSLKKWGKRWPEGPELGQG